VYEKDWAQYRKLRNLVFVVALGGMPVTLGLASLCAYLLTKTHWVVDPGLFMLAPGICWMGASLYYGLRVQLFTCPRCGEWFSGTWWYNLSFLARKCVHCGLKKFSTQP
jgi:hypothetical protein